MSIIVVLEEDFRASQFAEPWLHAIKPIDADLEEARNYLDCMSRASSLVDAHTATAVCFGEIATAIFSEVETQHSDLIVMCSHGYTGMKRWVLGSVAEKIMHYAPVPVLLLREGGPAFFGTPPHAGGHLRALIPLDGSARAKAALVPAAQLIAALSAPGPAALHLTRVVEFPDAARTSLSEREAIMHKAKQYLSASWSCGHKLRWTARRRNT